MARFVQRDGSGTAGPESRDLSSGAGGPEENPGMPVRRSIAGKLTLLLTLSLAAVFGATAALNVWIQGLATTRILRHSGLQVADLVAGATREAMLRNDRERIQATVGTLARQRNIAAIRILRKDGRIAYSSNRAEIGRVVGIERPQCRACHRQDPPPRRLPPGQEARVIGGDDHPVLAITRVIGNEPECAGAPCHVHPADTPILGVLDVHMDLRPYEQARLQSATELIVSSLVGILLVVGLVVVAIQRMVDRPVRALIEGVERLAAGDLAVRVPEVSDDELGLLARAFNRMARDLAAAREELIEWGRTLQRRVEEKTRELRQAQEHIVRVEKMASLGKLAAVVAHEINNPLSSVVTYAKTLVRRIRKHDMTDECRENLEYLEAIAGEAKRCGAIVSQLLAFARQKTGEFEPTDVNQVVEKALFLVDHKLELAGVEVVRDFDPDLPRVVVDPSQVQQALIALLINAAQAMEGGGEVRVTTRAVEEGVEVVVADTGPGMTPDVAAHAFEPFFTTKEDGGVGLGLSVVYGIVERHGGKIDLDTAPGRGCRFTLFFPARPPGPGGPGEEP